MEQQNLMQGGDHMSQSALQLQQQANQASGGAAGQVPSGRPYEAKFHYNEISTNNLNGIVPHITIDSRWVNWVAFSFC